MTDRSARSARRDLLAPERVRSMKLDTAVARVEEASGLVENSTMRFEPAGSGGPDNVDLVWEWERTRVGIRIRRAES